MVRPSLSALQNSLAFEMVDIQAVPSSESILTRRLDLFCLSADLALRLLLPAFLSAWLTDFLASAAFIFPILESLVMPSNRNCRSWIPSLAVSHGSTRGGGQRRACL